MMAYDTASNVCQALDTGVGGRTPATTTRSPVNGTGNKAEPMTTPGSGGGARAAASPALSSPQTPGSAYSESPGSDGDATERQIRWQRGELIGSGGFGRVYKGMDMDTGSLFAVKQIALAVGGGDMDGGGGGGGGGGGDRAGEGENESLRQIEMEVRPAGYHPPRHPTHFEPSFLDLNGIL